jgi:hypothetical protein
MREIRLFVLTILVVTPVLVFSQADTQSASQNSSPQKQSKITGCLTKTKDNQYRLVDQKKITNMVISNGVDLESYVGQSVTLIGAQSAKPSTDTGTGRPMPTFRVREVQPGSGTCK